MDRLDSWTPESPFLEAGEVVAHELESEGYTVAEVVVPWATKAETPFARDSENAHSESYESAEFINEVLAELEDESFTVSVSEMAYEAQAVVQAEGSGTLIANELSGIDQRRRYEQHFALLVAEAERMHSAVAEGFSNLDVSNSSEAELEAMVHRFVPQLSVPFSPAQEQFFGKLVRKVGKAVSGVVRFVKKGVAAVGRTVIGPLLKRLGALVRPLIQRVVQFAIGKLPEAVRPIAQNLAKKLFGGAKGGAPEQASLEPQAPLASAPTAEAIQLEYNLRVAEALLVSPADEQEHEQFFSAVSASESEGEDVAAKLHEATHQLAMQLAELKEGEDPRPAIQQFLPAALMALQPIIKTVIGIIGRDKVVGFLANLLAKLVSRWIGEEPARALAKPLVSVGLGLLGFEQAQNEEPRKIAGQVLAQTLQETVLSLVQQSPEALEQPEMLQALTMEAFEAAVASNFPPETLKEELREVAQEAGGRWTLYPGGGRRRYYKKFSQVFDVMLDPGALRRAKTFGSASVSEWLQATTGVDVSKKVKARVHVYELTMGSRLVDIARLEKGVNGLGSYYWSAWGRLMPLTPENAAELLPKGASGLGKAVAPAFLQGPYLVAPGQRFFFIEFPGQVSTVKPPSSTANDVGVIINLIRGAITVKIRLSEKTAQEIATYLRRRDAATPIQIMRRALGGLEALARGELRVGFRIEGEAELLQEYLAELSEMENLAPVAVAAGGAAAMLGRKVGAEVLTHIAKKLVDLIWTAILRYLQNKANDFIAATENPANGVTVLIAFDGIDSLKRIGQARRGDVAGGAIGFVMDRIRNTFLPATRLPMPSIAIRPGSV
jgi:hypothetical protein